PPCTCEPASTFSSNYSARLQPLTLFPGPRLRRVKSSRISTWSPYALLRPPYFTILFHADNFHSGNRIKHIRAGACGLRHDRRQRNDHAGFADTKFAGTIAQSESFAFTNADAGTPSEPISKPNSEPGAARRN